MPPFQNSPGYRGTKRHRRDARREWPERAGQVMAEPGRCDSEGGEFRQEHKQGRWQRAEKVLWSGKSKNAEEKAWRQARELISHKEAQEENCCLYHVQ